MRQDLDAIFIGELRDDFMLRRKWNFKAKKEVKQSAEKNLSSFDKKINIPNENTIQAIEEARRIARDKSTKIYDNIKELTLDLEV